MDIPSYMTVIAKLFTMLDLLLKNYVYNGYSALASNLRYPLGLAVTLYISIMGISISQGWVKLSMSNLVKSAFKLGLIYMFAMNWDAFSFYVVSGIEGSAGQIGDWLVNASPIPLPHFGGEGINGALQSVLIEVTKVGLWTWEKGSFRNLSSSFTALAIWGFGYMALIFAIIEIVLAKMMLAILFTLAPLFIGFTLFKTTHALFDRWLGAILGFALFLIFIPAAVALLLSFMQWTLAGEYAEQAANMKVVGFIPLMIVSFLGVLLVRQVTEYAKNIGGSVSSTSGSSLLAGAIGGVIGSSMSATAPLRRMGTGLIKSGASMMNAIHKRLRGGT